MNLNKFDLYLGILWLCLSRLMDFLLQGQSNKCPRVIILSWSQNSRDCREPESASHENHRTNAEKIS